MCVQMNDEPKATHANYRAASAANLPALPNPTLGGSVIRPRRDVKSWMWEHVRDMHGGVVEGMGDFKMKVTGKFRKCLERQVSEGIQITLCKNEGGTLLNSKNEYFTPKNVETIFKQW